MASQYTITHSGIVMAIDPTHSTLLVSVSHESGQECSSCAAASLCHSRGALLTVHSDQPTSYHVGETVQIAASGAMHRRSVALMLGVPLLAFLLPMLITLMCGGAPWLALCVALGGCVLAYSILYALRRKIDDVVNFNIIS